MLLSKLKMYVHMNCQFRISSQTKNNLILTGKNCHKKLIRCPMLSALKLFLVAFLSFHTYNVLSARILSTNDNILYNSGNNHSCIF